MLDEFDSPVGVAGLKSLPLARALGRIPTSLHTRHTGRILSMGPVPVIDHRYASDRRGLRGDHAGIPEVSLFALVALTFATITTTRN